MDGALGWAELEGLGGTWIGWGLGVGGARRMRRFLIGRHPLVGGARRMKRGLTGQGLRGGGGLGGALGWEELEGLGVALIGQ